MNRLHAALPIVLKKHVWDLKYGLFGYPEFSAPEDTLQHLSLVMPETGSLLELGCGRGSLIRGLRQAGWRGHYCGVDISKKAIRDAHAFGDQRSSWVVSDFESFRSPFQWETVAMIESLYYIKLDDCPAVLGGLTSMLAPRGRLVVRLHDPQKYTAYVEMLYRLYPGTARVSNALYSIAGDSQAAVS